MRAEIILTTIRNAKLEELVIGEVEVTNRTNVRGVLSKHASKRFDSIHHVRRDNNVFGWVAVDAHGNTIHLK